MNADVAPVEDPIAVTGAREPSGPMRHLFSIDDLTADQLRDLLNLSDRFTEVAERQVPKVPALRGRTVALAFFEDSTRTRLSFDLAAKRLSADVLTFSASGSSLNKGESLRDTVETIDALGVDALVVRHSQAGVPQQVARWLDDRVAVINAGDGAHQHPTQAIGDIHAYCTHRAEQGKPTRHPGSIVGGRGWQPPPPPLAAPSSDDPWNLTGVRVGLVGDIAHSRVARSTVSAWTKLGAEVTLVAPPTLLPADLSLWPEVTVSDRLNGADHRFDVAYLLRLQRERAAGVFGSVREYTNLYGLNSDWSFSMMPEGVVMHPGPVNRGVEIADQLLDPGGLARRYLEGRDEPADRLSGIADGWRMLKNRQVTHGVAGRMAVLFSLLGGGTPAALHGGGTPAERHSEGSATGAGASDA